MSGELSLTIYKNTNSDPPCWVPESVTFLLQQWRGHMFAFYSHAHSSPERHQTPIHTPIWILTKICTAASPVKHLGSACLMGHVSKLGFCFSVPCSFAGVIFLWQHRRESCQTMNRQTALKSLPPSLLSELTLLTASFQSQKSQKSNKNVVLKKEPVKRSVYITQTYTLPSRTALFSRDRKSWLLSSAVHLQSSIAAIFSALCLPLLDIIEKYNHSNKENNRQSATRDRFRFHLHQSKHNLQIFKHAKVHICQLKDSNEHVGIWPAEVPSLQSRTQPRFITSRAGTVVLQHVLLFLHSDKKNHWGGCWINRLANLLLCSLDILEQSLWILNWYGWTTGHAILVGRVATPSTHGPVYQK